MQRGGYGQDGGYGGNMGMKRPNSDGRDGGQKKSRAVGDSEVRIVIPNKAAGSIIGKAGANINRLRTENSASVTVPDCSGPERLLTVNADAENLLKVVEDIFKGIDENRANEAARGRKDEFTSKPGEADVRLLVHQSQVGAIIGKGGVKIKELKENCNCSIKVHPDVCPGSTDRVVQLIGPIENTVSCLREILVVLRDTSPPRGPVIPYDPTYAVQPASEEFYPEMPMGGGMGGGMMGGRGRGAPAGRGGGMSRGGMGGMGGMNGSGFGTGRGGPAQGGFGEQQSYGAQPAMGGYGEMGGAPEEGEKSSTQVTIPKDMAGAIIGKGGNKIRQIRQESGAHIQIDDPATGSTDRIITITGNSTQIWRAQYMLQQSVRESMQGTTTKQF